MSDLLTPSGTRPISPEPTRQSPQTAERMPRTSPVVGTAPGSPASAGSVSEEQRPRADVRESAPPADDGAATPHSAEPTDDGAGNSGSLPVHVAAGALPAVWAALERMAIDPRADVEKLERMMALYERLEAGRARQAYNEAMNLAQAEIEPVARTTENTVTRSFYAKLEAVDAAIRPIYTRHGFSLSDDTVEPLTPGHVRIECRCSHVGGHTEVFHREAPADTIGPKGSPTKTALHGIGSTETFLRRYLRCGIFNVVFRNLDDDGNGGPMGEAQIAELVDLMIRAKVGGRFQRYMKWPVFDKEEYTAKVESAGSPEVMWDEYLRAVPGADYAKAKSALMEQIAKRESNEKQSC